MFKINNDIWSIKIINENNLLLQMPDGKYTFGMCDNSKKVIYLSNKIKNKDTIKKVIYHELFHATMFSYNIKLNYNDEELFANLMSIYGEDIVNQANKIFKELHI